jgi:hypothetical protein|tara:strand:+ start:2886 stop:3149 length:264 start_codon:yes stop_codon:yes gene_type:complete
MPKYFYFCSTCEVKIGLYHSMNDVVEDCPECNNRECLKKIPSYFSIKNTLDDKKETGELVKESIEEFKEDLQNQKEKLKTEFIKHDE